jgi:hypothetical protein
MMVPPSLVNEKLKLILLVSIEFIVNDIGVAINPFIESFNIISEAFKLQSDLNFPEIGCSVSKTNRAFLSYGSWAIFF